MSDSPPPRKTRRSSILKASRAPLQSLEDNNEGYDEDRTTVTRTATFKRRVSFSSTNKVQEFCNEAAEIWGDRYEKPMTVAEANVLNPVNLQGSKSFESLMTGEIKNCPNSFQVRNEVQFTYSESVSKTRSNNVHPVNVPEPMEQDEEMELTSTDMPVYSQESQNTQSSQAQVTVINCQAPVALDKENLTVGRSNLLDKTTLSTLNMSMDGGHSLTEDASYLNSPGFNKTHLSMFDVDDSEEADDLLDILGTPHHNVPGKAMNKTANESLCMDITSVAKPVQVEEDEEKTEDLALDLRGNNTFKNLTYLDEDNTHDILKEDEIASRSSSMDTDDLVPAESVSSLSKHRRSLSFNQTGASGQMDMTGAVHNATAASMEMTIAPNSSNAQMEMTMAALDTDKWKEDCSVENTLPAKTSMNRTLRQPLEMSFDQSPMSQVASKSIVSDKGDVTNYQALDVSLEETVGNWKSAAPNSSEPLEPATPNIPNLNSTRSIDLNDENETVPKQFLDSWPTPEVPPVADLLSEESLAKPLTPEESIIGETSRVSNLNKTFDVHASRLPLNSMMDCTSVSVPDETLSDSVFLLEEVKCSSTEIDSKDNHRQIRSVNSRLIDKFHDESFRSENTKIVDVPKNLDTPDSDTRRYSQTEDIGDIMINETGHMSVNLKCVEKSGVYTPDHLPSQQVVLSTDQELILSPNSKAVVVTRPSPEKFGSRSMLEKGSSSNVRTSPICRSFNAVYNIPSVQITEATPEDETLSEVEDSPECQIDKQMQKYRRQTVEHSPVKKTCYSSVQRGLSMSVGNIDKSTKSCQGASKNCSFGNFGNSRRIDFDASCKADDFNFSRKSEMDISRRSEFDTSKMSISFVPPENRSQETLNLNAFDEFEEMMASKKSTKLDEINQKMDEILAWHKDRKLKREKEMAQKQTERVTSPSEDPMEVDKQMDVPDTPLTPTAAKLKQMCHKVERCWRFVADEIYGIELSILNDTMKMVFAMDSEDVVKKISLTPIKKAPVERFVHKLFQQKVKTEDLMKECRSKNDIPKLLKELHSKLVKFTHLMITMQRASTDHVLSYQGTRIHFRCYSLKLAIAIEVSIDLAKWDKVSEDDVEVCTFVGNLEFKEIPSLVAYERRNEYFLPKYIKAIEDLITTKEKFA